MQSADLRERVDRAEGAREVFQRSRVPHADPMFRQAPTCSDGHSFRWKTSREGSRDGQDPRAPEAALRRSEDRAAKLAEAMVQEMVA